MLAELSLLLTYVSASAIPLANADASKRDDFPLVNSDVSNAIGNSVEEIISDTPLNNTQVFNDIESSINYHSGRLDQDVDNLGPFHFYPIIEHAVENLPSDVDDYKDDLVQQIEEDVSDPSRSPPHKRDSYSPLSPELVNAISSGINSTESLPSADRTQILNDIENSIYSQLRDIAQGPEVLDPLYVSLFIKRAVKSLPGEFDQSKDTLIQKIVAAINSLPDVQIPNLP
ncbi:hypothetical protein ZYGM_001425 [Zygosaccharomyces mellis]|uniref:Uncharacterized protein n=1 Tax=Zygosaccharomyces mellis TaxID=42258 RepID=A0A4C2EAL1_9SACH|nr:hypothetical protein ZYGM_001425 [Zygosaccharomyces mellis]